MYISTFEKIVRRHVKISLYRYQMSTNSSSSLREDVFHSRTCSTMTNICLAVTVKKNQWNYPILMIQ